MTKKRIGIVGATGYTGSELVRLLKTHPEVEIAIITSESRAGERFSDVHPTFRGIVDDKLKKAEQVLETELDLVFLALPHGVSMEYVKKFRDSSFKIVDLSGDYRLDSPQTYESWYKKDHTFPEAFEDAVYGLPELFADDIRQARLVANPGCFPTGGILALAPLMKQGMIDPQRVIVDSKTGVTGAGIKPSGVTHFSNVSDNFKAYGLKKHRHTIEIQNTLSRLGGRDATIQFTPHLLPVDRGILSTVYAQPTGKVTEEQVKQTFAEFYRDKPFVRLTEVAPSIKEVRASNYCDIYCTLDERTNTIIVISVIDNLVKGAAGQAVHNMNLMFGMDETAGLLHLPINP